MPSLSLASGAASPPLRPVTVLSRLLLPAALLLGVALPAQAQDPTTDPRVPSLTPREFEIRGDVRVALPQIERQPLSGFGPPPRTYVVPADRAALTGAYDPDLDALPPLALAPPAEPEDNLPVARRLRLEGTYGAQAGRTTRFDVIAPVASGQISADFDYEGVGWETDLEDLAFDRLRGGVALHTGGRLQFGLEASGVVDRYGMPAVRESQNLAEMPLRRLTRLGGRASLTGVGSLPFDAAIRYSGDRLAPASDGADAVLGPSQSAALVDATLEATFADRLRIDAGAGTIGLDGGLGEDAQYAAGGAALLLGSPGRFQLALGARALGYRAGASNGDGDATAIAPLVDLSFNAGPSLRLFASNDPGLGVRGLGDLAETNPFVVDRPVIAPDLLRTNARVGVELVSARLRLQGFAHYTDAPTWLVFDRAPDGRFFEGYEGVRIQGATARASIVAASGVSVEVGATARQGEITENGGEIPFFSPLTFRGGLQVPFARGRLGLTAYHETARPDSRGGFTEVDGFTLLSADARYDLTGSIALLLQADRLAGTVEEWPGYALPGTTVRGGLRVTL